jgi:hypothetical protein
VLCSFRFRRQQQRQHPLLEEFHGALAHLRFSRRQLDFCDPEFTDATVFNIDAAECRIVAVLKQARKEGVTAW